MPRSRRYGVPSSVHIDISAPFSGQLVNGADNIVQAGSPAARTGTEHEQLQLAFAEVRTILRARVGAADLEAAELHLHQLEEVALSPNPDLDTVVEAQHWFTRHVPKVAGTVTGLLIHPLLGLLTEIAGETAIDELRRRRPDPTAGPPP